MLPAYKNEYTETLYTLSDAEKIIDYKREVLSRMRKKKAIYYLKQKACGVAMVALGIGTIFIDMDMTAAVVIVPLGLFITFTKQCVMLFK